MNARGYTPWLIRGYNRPTPLRNDPHRMDALLSPEIWIALVTLTALELVLGIDNIIFISILAGKLPPEQRQTVESYYYERTPVERLAERSGRSVEALYKVLQRVRQALLDCVTRALKAEGGAS